MKADNFIIEIGSLQMNKNGNDVCGDTILSRKINSENRYVTVLCDGLGSGIKANVLSTLTASMALNFRIKNESIIDSAKWIMDTLPTDSERIISYCTFSIIDVDFEGYATVIEYGNPSFFVIRNSKVITPKYKEYIITQGGKQKVLKISEFKLLENDRLVAVTDGITQSGMGNPSMPFGWGVEALHKFVLSKIVNNSEISAADLTHALIKKAFDNDRMKFKDDTSCVVFYRRKPRKLLICTGPPYTKENDRIMINILSEFDGIKIVCGGTTANIVARELHKEIVVDSLKIGRNNLPPASRIDGINYVTEGILTLSKIVELLNYNRELDMYDDDPAIRLVNYMLTADIIYFLVGTCINIAHQDPNFPVELDIRRNVVKRIAELLENQCLKQVKIQYI